jgi:hypothetical protein
MREHDWNAVGGLIQPPGLDAITEEQITPGDRVVDTLYNMDTGHVFYMNGRRYVTERTVRLLARALGYRLHKIPEDEDAPRI